MEKTMLGAVVGAAALQLALLATAGAAQFSYKVTDLGDEPTGSALNDSGQIVGSTHVNNHRRAFLTGPDGIGINLLPLLSGDLESIALGVNNLGQVTGYSYDTRNPQPPAHVFVTGSGGSSPQSLGIGTGFDINNLGQVTGILVNGGMFLSGVNGQPLKFLGRLPGSTYALPSAVNDLGQVAGESGFGLGFSDRRAFVSGPDGGALKELGAPGKGRSASDVNNLGQAVGYAQVNRNHAHAFLSDTNGRLRDLGTLFPGTSSNALAINEAGVVVGISFRPEDDPDGIFADAFVFTAANDMQNLNDLINPRLNIQLFQADDINERGQILALGFAGNEQHTFLLTPITHVPDTGSAIMLFCCTLIALVLFGTLVRRDAVNSSSNSRM